MKNLSYFVVIFILFMGFSWIYHYSKVTVMEVEIEQLTSERDELKNKIVLIEEGLMSLSNGNQKKPQKQETKSVRIKTEPVVVNNTIKPKSETKVSKKTVENMSDKDISLGFPNRTGQDLVNSLKFKTGL